MSSTKQPKGKSVPAALAGAGKLAMTKRAALQPNEAPGQQAAPTLKTAVWGPVLPSAHAAAVMTSYSKHFGTQDTDCTALRELLRDQMGDVVKGNSKAAESMLIGQAFTLQSMFSQLALRAERQELLSHWETHMRMALKVQNQCRMTLETLATIQNPPVVFAKQANINNGRQQQVNNGATPLTPPSHAVNEQSEQNKLLEAPDGERMDFGTKGATTAGDSAMAPVGAVDGAANHRGKGQGRKERRQGPAAGGIARARKSPARSA